MEQIKQIPTEFIGRGEVRGFKYSKLDSPNGGFIYAVDNNGTKYYEYFLERINKQFNNVSYPSSKAFGVWAWWTDSYEDAITKLSSVIKDRRKDD
jgi:hypothetical protein